MRPSAEQLLTWLRSPQRHSYKDHDHLVCDDDEWIWRINDDEVPAKRQERIFGWVDKQLRMRERCPYCGTALTCDESFEYSIDDEETLISCEEPLETDMYIHGTLALCPRCWYWHWFSGGTMGRVVVWDAAIAKMRKFDPRAPEGCMQELAMYLRQNPNHWGSIDPTSLEKIVAEIWRQNYAHSDVLHVGRPNDGGVDVLFVDSNSRQWLIQVKRRKSSKLGEGVSTLRNLLGAMQLQGTSLGVVVSTADHFTHYAIEASKKMAAMGTTVELVDRGKLDRMLQGFHPAFPWMDFLDANYPTLADFYSERGFGRV